MRVAIQLTADAGPWNELVDYVVEAEAMGVEVCWVAEAWGTDAATPIGFLAARTSTMLLGSGIFQVGSRSAALSAMTALTLQRITNGRFLLGLGVSGPQVMEGLHGVPFAKPLSRLKDTVAVLRKAEAGERIEHDGSTLTLPLPGGEGKALRLSQPVPETPIPLYIASLSPNTLAYTGEAADGWIGTSFIPEGADTAYFQHLRAGAEKAGRSLSELDLCQGAEVAFGDDLPAMAAKRKMGLAFSLGGMGSGSTNFYNSAYARAGFEEVAAESQRRWLTGDRTGAADVIPDEMVLATTLVGPEEHVHDRLQLWKDSGITTVRLYPAGDTLSDRLNTLGRAIDLVGAVS